MSRLFSMLFLFSACASYADRKFYIPSENVHSAENSISLQSSHSVLPLESISCNDEDERYYFAVDLMRCRACGHHTQHPAKKVCYNDECGLYPW